MGGLVYTIHTAGPAHDEGHQTERTHTLWMRETEGCSENCTSACGTIIAAAAGYTAVFDTVIEGPSRPPPPPPSVPTRPIGNPVAERGLRLPTTASDPACLPHRANPPNWGFLSISCPLDAGCSALLLRVRLMFVPSTAPAAAAAEAAVEGNEGLS